MATARRIEVRTSRRASMIGLRPMCALTTRRPPRPRVSFRRRFAQHIREGPEQIAALAAMARHALLSAADRAERPGDVGPGRRGQILAIPEQFQALGLEAIERPRRELADTFHRR